MPKRGSKNKGCRGRHKVVDRISNLPDAILHHILSFVPTKSNVKTSILSKRWKYLWPEVPALDFTEMILPRYHGASKSNLTPVQRFYFEKFVDKVLFLNNSSHIQRLRFLIFEDLLLGSHDLYVKYWLDVVSRHNNICEVCVWVSWSFMQKVEPIPFPTRLLWNKKLVVLKLEGAFALEFPISFHMPNLKILHLIRMRFDHDELMKNLTSSFPVLEKLVIKFLGVSYIESATLRTLKVANNSSKPSTVIKAPNLKYLCLEGCLKSYKIYDPSSVEIVKLVTDVYKIAFEDLTQFSAMRSLYLDVGLDEAVYPSIPLDVCATPTFESLTCLTIDYSHLCVLYMCLNCSPKLKSLIIRYLQDMDSFDAAQLLPKRCECLENVVLDSFCGEADLVIVQYFLEAGLILKKMTIHFKVCGDVDPVFGTWADLEEKDSCIRDVLKTVSELPSSSPACQVEIIVEE